MTAAFLQAAIPESVTCLGVRLKVFSWGHYLWLLRWQSPFIFRHRPATPDDLLKAVMVCSTDWKHGREIFSDPDLPSDLRRWMWKLRGSPLRLRFWRSLLKGYDFAPAIALFEKYVEASGAANTDESRKLLPRVFASTGGASVGSPGPFLTMATLMKMGQTLDSIFDQPHLLTRWLVAAYGEVEGQLTVKDREEVESLKAEANRIAEEAVAEAAKGRS